MQSLTAIEIPLVPTCVYLGMEFNMYIMIFYISVLNKNLPYVYHSGILGLGHTES